MVAKAGPSEKRGKVVEFRESRSIAEMRPEIKMLTVRRRLVFGRHVSEETMDQINWDIRREGRAWQGDEAWNRYQLSAEKIEMIEGKLFWDEEQRINMLGLLLENVGVDAAVRLGDPHVWRDAVADL